MDTKELYIDVDKQVMEELKGLLFRHNIYGLMNDTYYPKKTASEDFYNVCLKGLEKGSCHNAYRVVLEEVFKDKLPNKEPSMIRGIKDFNKAPLPILYSVIQSHMYKYYGEFWDRDYSSAYPTIEEVKNNG